MDRETADGKAVGQEAMGSDMVGRETANKEAENVEMNRTADRKMMNKGDCRKHYSKKDRPEGAGRELWEQAGSLLPDDAGRKRAMDVIRAEIAGKNIRHVPSGRELIVIELQYISPFFWLMQGILVMGLLLLFILNPNQERKFMDDIRWISIEAAWMGVITCSDLSRHISRGMAELEQSCYFNLPQMWTMRMIFTGIVDILLLAFCSGRIAETAAVPFVQVCIYGLVPFVLSNICCLQLFTFMRGGRGRYGQLAMAFLAGMIAMVPSVTPSWYEIEFLGLWSGVLLTGVLLLLWQIWILYGKMNRGEILCWN